MFKKDNFWFGLALGLLAPVLGIAIFKFTRFRSYSFEVVLNYMIQETGYKTLTVALSLSLLLNALLFTLYINNRKDKTAKGIFITTVVYGLLVLAIKTFF
jgi:hypothetical protein